jgi:N-acetyl-gamma-glutamyl-phosphate reductase
MPDAPASIPVAVLGGTGYVSGELLRLLAGHPRFAVVAVASTSQAGEPVVKAFPHLAGTVLDPLVFSRIEDLPRPAASGVPLGVLAATPHGETAAPLNALLARAERAGVDVRAVDLSADFRFADAARWEAIYGRPHGAPERAATFACAVPEHWQGEVPRFAAQPGCFTTAVTLAAYPLLALGLADPAAEIFVSAVTGSSGSGRSPSATTHHPERRSSLHAYAPLAHRHEAEMRRLLAPACGGVEPEIAFVPHSGPFVRGIHATLRIPLAEPLAAAELAARIAEFYREAPFVSVSTAPPRLTEVVGTNRCRIGVAARGRTAVLLSAIDNLVKGAAGGGVQWLNRLFGLPDDTGLRLPGLGWY